jgi:ABC-type dipeptide/oligopeptide/nickel transport system ATPase component
MYETFYGFSAKPFQLRPDPHFFFGSKGHKRAMAYLEYGLSQGEGFIVVTGEVGAGKTTLVRNLFNRLPSDQIVAAHIVNTHLDPDDTLRMVVSAFGLPYEGASKTDLLTAWKNSCATSTTRASAPCWSSTKPRTCPRARSKNCACCRTSRPTTSRCCRPSCSASRNSAPRCTAPACSSCASA